MSDQKKTKRLSRKARLGFSALVTFLLVLFTLLALETFFRMRASHIVSQKESWLKKVGVIESDPGLLVRYTDRGRRLIPGARVLIRNHILSHRDVPININSLGFRGPEIEVPKPAESYRVLVLGDSITLADYLEDELTFVRRLEARLRAARPGRSVEAVNAGIGDIGLSEELDILEETGLQLEPDLVVVAFYLNDSRPPWGFVGELGRYGFIRRHSVLAQAIHAELLKREWIKEKGAARVLWVRGLNWKEDPEALALMISLAELDWGSLWKDEAWTIIDRELERLKGLRDKHGFEVLIVCFPVRYQVYADYLEDKPQRRMEERARRLGFHYLDLLPRLREQSQVEYFYDHCHPNQDGNDLIGKLIADFILSRIMPPESPRN